jgi:hypothetical protein
MSFFGVSVWLRTNAANLAVLFENAGSIPALRIFFGGSLSGSGRCAMRETAPRPTRNGGPPAMRAGYWGNPAARVSSTERRF